MAITRADFAEECVRQARRFGVNPHFLIASAELRSRISDLAQGAMLGPFSLTQSEWDANCFDAELGITDFVPSDVAEWDMQCVVYALMTRRAQNLTLSELGRYPSADELYERQWGPAQPAPPGALQVALDSTANLVDPAILAVTGQPPPAPAALPSAGTASATPLDNETGKTSEDVFRHKAPQLIERVMDDFDLADFQAAGVIGNIGHECAGFLHLQEIRPAGAPGRGGYGWCQWTGSRRVDFESFCGSEGLDPTSDAANYANLKRELGSTHKSSITALKPTTTLPQAVRAFEKEFERAGIKHYDARDRWATIALAAYKRVLPQGATRLLDRDASFAVTDTATFGRSGYWIVDEFSEAGGQVLIEQLEGQKPAVIRRDTTVFPLNGSGLPALVEAKLARNYVLLPAASAAAPSAPPRPAVTAAALLFAEAAKCDETLVTRYVPNTRNGRLACAWAINEVARRALGAPIGGGLSTSDMAKVLRSHHRSASEAEVTAGMIIISPTNGDSTGHVGIIGRVLNPLDATTVYSNSSKRGVFSHAFKIGTWKKYYRDRLNLDVLYYWP